MRAWTVTGPLNWSKSIPRIRVDVEGMEMEGFRTAVAAVVASFAVVFGRDLKVFEETSPFTTSEAVIIAFQVRGEIFENKVIEVNFT